MTSSRAQRLMAARRALVKRMNLAPLPVTQPLAAALGGRRMSFEVLATLTGEVVCVRVHDLFVIDHAAFACLRAGARDEIRRLLATDVVWLAQGGRDMGGIHSSAALLAITGASGPAPALAIDAGAGGGLLGLARWRRGARHVVFVEHDERALAEARRNAALNDLPEGCAQFLAADLAQPSRILAALPAAGSGPIAIDANLGFWPEYPVTSFSAYALARLLISRAASVALVSAGHLIDEARVLPVLAGVRGRRRLACAVPAEVDLLTALGFTPVLVAVPDAGDQLRPGWTALPHEAPGDATQASVFGDDLVRALERDAPHMLSFPVIRPAQIPLDLTALARNVLERMGFSLPPEEAHIAPVAAAGIEGARAFRARFP